MKRKYLSALLMGTLTVASMSTFTSCKDYDDDISNLQGQIDKLATADQLSQKVAELQALISSNTSSIGTLQSALEEAKKAAEKAQTTADSKATLDQVNGILADYAKVSYVDDAKKSLNDAIEALKTGDITTLKADVEAAAKAAAAAKADAEAAIVEVKKDLADNYVKNATFESEKTAVQAALETLTNQVQTNAGNIQKNVDAIVKLQAVDVVTKADLVAKLGEYATAQQAKDLQKELTDLKTNFAEEIAKYALKSDLNSLATKEELQKASEKAANDLQTKLNEYLKADVLASLATKDDIRDLQNKEAVQNLIKEAILALKNGDIKSIGDKAEQALQKANKAESTEGLAYVKALAAEGKAIAAADKAATADSKAEANKSEIATIKDILGDKFDAKNTVSAAIELINSQLTNDKTGLAALAGRLSSIESLLNQDTPDATSLKTRVDNIENKLKDIIGQYSTMVTDVQLYNFTTAANNEFDQKLNFIQATEQANVFPGAGVADAQFTFEKGKYFAGEDSLLIRVSPVDAELTTSNVSLLNSQGTELNDLIEVTDAHRYNGLLYGAETRAGVDANTGLWVVKFKAKDLGKAFDAAAKVKVGENDFRSILYSVAVKNTYTTDEAKDRRVTSEYGVSLWSDVALHAFDFKVGKTPIGEIKNRYDVNAQELEWINNAKPATTVITKEGNTQNAKDRATGIDDRHDKKLLAVEVGSDIVIDFTNMISPEVVGYSKNKDFGVKGFYVTLDEDFAGESGVSEINAWRSYTYENVGYKGGKPAKLFTGNKGTIKIQNMNNVKGDVIGFRVYAVNYDGTLTDPDGRAFYVAVGDAKVDMTIPATTVSLDKTTANHDQPTFVSPKVNVDFSKCSDFDASDEYKWTVTAKDKSGADVQVSGNEFSVKYFKADGSETDKLSKEVTAIQFVLDKPNKFVDNEIYTVSTTLQKNIAGAIADVSTVTASFKKEMPKEAPTFGYRDGFDKFEYIIPEDGYKVNEPVDGKIANKGGEFDFRNILIINGNQNSYHGVDLFTKGVFNFNVANGTYKSANNKYVLTNAKAEYVDDTNQYILAVNNGGANLVDNKTERTITANFVYKNISKQQVEVVVNGVKTKVWKDDVEYPVPSASSEKIVYCSWMKTFNIADKGGYNWVGKPAVTDKNGNVKEPAIAANDTVKWEANPTGAKELELKYVTAKVADLKAIPTAVVSTVKGANLADFFTSGVITLVSDRTYGDVWTTSADGKQINPYFTAKIENGKIKLTQNNQTAIPSNVKGGLIHFTVRDCFGNTKAIQLPFVIKMPEVTARKH